MRLYFAAGLLGLAVAAPSAPASAPHVLHEKRHSQPSRWIKQDRAQGILPMRIGLTQSNLDNAHNHLMDLSHPDSPNYGKHWTAQQVVDAFRPSDDTVQTVQQWLEDSGITGITHSDNKAWLAFHATVPQAESLLHTEYFEYEDVHTGGILPACEQYHVPQHIQEHIDYITPGIRLLSPEGVAPTPNHLTKRGNAEGEIGLHKNTKAAARTRGPHVRVPTRAPPANASDLSICDQIITPACIAALYNIPPTNLTHPLNPNNSLGIFESELQFWDQEDLNLFFSNFTPSQIPNNTHPTSLNINGGRAFTNYTNEGGVESMLDLEIAYPIVYPQNITVYNVDDIHYQTWPNNTYTWGFNTLLDAIDGSYCSFAAYNETGNLPDWDPTYPDLSPFQGYNGTLQCGLFEPTNVISVSYGGQEADVPIAYQKRQCLEFLKMGLQGVSFLFASGDAGVGNYPASQGGIDGETGCLGPKGDVFNPTWPNTCPYITNIGGTKVYPNHSVITEPQPESAANDPAAGGYSSGGGFSNIYPIPDYQAAAVASYFANFSPPFPYYCALAPDTNGTTTGSGTPYDLLNITALQSGTQGKENNGTLGLYNRIGRGVPDVSANGDEIATFVKGKYVVSGGTSASTPIFAAVLNRINEERLGLGKGPVGFVNPVLYRHPEVLNDVVNGTNMGCGHEGFNAVKGWDPVTGLGTPNYPKMLELFLSLP
ncbi:hypothetical protein LTR86_009718 [Recurvomyces mirabilis]|nr:hypothetical protein LTR86_009718 [Recurvomyces mirabilis]